ncbi:MAG: hypothetical protein KA194_11260 [Alcaligenes sp.]|nr:hypothetical protein [Alcaligenes sp.]
MGGEEFALIMPATDALGARHMWPSRYVQQLKS